MLENVLKELETISKAVAKPPYLMQGCGGSISVKTNEGFMVVGELRYHVKQGGENREFAIINFQNIKTYYSIVNIELDLNFDKISQILIRQNVVQQKKYKTLEPSLEVGFHSLLDRYVIHTHSAYANILGCGENGEGLMYTIFSDKDVDCFWIPCSEPSFYMNYLIKQAMGQNTENPLQQSNVFFLENHGVIVTSNDMNKAIDTSMMVNDSIKRHFRIHEKDIC